MGHGQGGSKNRRMPAARPPPRRPSEADAGPTITEKIAARKRAGGAESWDDFKAKMKERQQEQFNADNHEVLMSAHHRELLDKERDARLAGAQPETKRHKSDKSDKKDKHKKEKRKKEKRKKEKRKKEKRKNEKSKRRGARRHAACRAYAAPNAQRFSRMPACPCGRRVVKQLIVRRGGAEWQGERARQVERLLGGR